MVISIPPEKNLGDSSLSVLFLSEEGEDRWVVFGLLTREMVVKMWIYFLQYHRTQVGKGYAEQRFNSQHR